MIMIARSRVSSLYKFVRALYAQAIIVAYASPRFSSTSKTKPSICGHFQDDLVLLDAGRYLRAQRIRIFCGYERHVR